MLACMYVCMLVCMYVSLSLASPLFHTRHLTYILGLLSILGLLPTSWAAPLVIIGLLSSSSWAFSLLPPGPLLSAPRLPLSSLLGFLSSILKLSPPSWASLSCHTRSTLDGQSTLLCALEERETRYVNPPTKENESERFFDGRMDGRQLRRHFERTPSRHT